MIHIVKGFSAVSEAEVDVFLEFSCFFYYPSEVGNLISAFSKSSLFIWNFSVHVLLKPCFKNFQHCFASMWDEYYCVVVWIFFDITSATAKSLQSCLTLCNPIPGILQARTLEWVAISFSNAWKWKLKVKSLSHVRLFATPWTAAYKPLPSMGFSRQEYWSGVPLPSPSLTLSGIEKNHLMQFKNEFSFKVCQANTSLKNVTLSFALSIIITFCQSWFQGKVFILGQEVFFHQLGISDSILELKQKLISWISKDIQAKFSRFKYLIYFSNHG